MAGEGHFGQMGLPDTTSPGNIETFRIRQALGEVRTMVPVKIIAVHGGGVGPAPTVDVQPLINQINGIGQQTPHGIIYGIAVSRNQGGGSAIINDPVVGDVGFISVADRDISALKANNGEQSNPGSYRTHDMADGIYTGAMLNPANPEQFVHFSSDGVTIADKNGNTLQMGAGGVTISGSGDTAVQSSGMLLLGGDGSGSYEFVETAGGTSTKVKAAI